MLGGVGFLPSTVGHTWIRTVTLGLVLKQKHEVICVGAWWTASLIAMKVKMTSKTPMY